MYDYELDSFAVAIRAIWLLWRRGQWGLLEKLGLSEKAIDKGLSQASMQFSRPRTERQLFYVLSRCPMVADAALDVLRRYYEACGESRTEFWQALDLLKGRLHGEEVVPRPF